jgi:hypothetical protein
METKQELLTINGKEYLLDIEQAEKLGLLKGKDDKVKSWDEFMKKYSRASSFTWAQLTQHEADAIAAFSKLLKLRRDWIGEWEPDWSNKQTGHGVIWLNRNEIQANTAYTIAFPLSFPKYTMAKEFLDTFRELIEEAKILI